MSEPSTPHETLTHAQRRARRPVAALPLRRSRHGRWLAGIAAGIARFVGTDVRLVRALWIVTVPLSLGITVLGYLLLWVLMPSEPRSKER